MGASGEWNVGQLMRERYGQEAVLIGFSTHHGWVRAADDWDAPGKRKRIRDGLPGSWEDLFHQLGTARFLLPLRDNTELRELTAQRRLQRAIGVIYRPETERLSHYFHTRLPQQFDAMIHLDETDALEPLDRFSAVSDEEVPDTYPAGI
jgi:erythromycin esterase-like protein